jgi:hypothetical protein
MLIDHIDSYFDGLSHKDIKKAAEHLAPNVLLLSPVFPEPFEGKDTVTNVLAGLLETIDSIQPDLKLGSNRDFAMFFTIECEGVTVNGAEHIHLDENGLIERIKVAWRPLASAVLIQEKLARKLGGTPLRLVSASEAV